MLRVRYGPAHDQQTLWAQITRLRGLRSLHVSHTEGAAAAQAFPALQGLTHLWLSLVRGQRPDQGLLGALGQLAGLASLHLGDCCGVALEPLAALQQQLTALDLGYCVCPERAAGEGAGWPGAAAPADGELQGTSVHPATAAAAGLSRLQEARVWPSAWAAVAVRRGCSRRACP